MRAVLDYCNALLRKFGFKASNGVGLVGGKVGKHCIGKKRQERGHEDGLSSQARVNIHCIQHTCTSQEWREKTQECELCFDGHDVGIGFISRRVPERLLESLDWLLP